MVAEFCPFGWSHFILSNLTRPSREKSPLSSFATFRVSTQQAREDRTNIALRARNKANCNPLLIIEIGDDMRLRALLVLLFTLVSLAPFAAHAETTPTEAAAIAAANNDHTAYTLPPDKLAKAQALHRIARRSRLSEHRCGASWFWPSSFNSASPRECATSRSIFRRTAGRRDSPSSSSSSCSRRCLSLPLDLYGQHVRSAYGLSVQRWGAGSATRARASRSPSSSAASESCCSSFSSANFPAAGGLWLWFPTMAFTAARHLRQPLHHRSALQ